MMLAATRLNVMRGGRQLLADVSLMASAGDFIAVIGPNGAGKSTLLSLLAGLTKPDSGTVTLDGRRLEAIADLARRRAYLPQNPHLEWPIPLAQLVALGLTPQLPVWGAMPASFRAAIDAALEKTALWDRRDQPATTLSGGEFARAMLARALVGDPDILIVDEPITGLDPRHAIASMRLLSGQAAAGKIVIASLHDLTLAARYASRVIALKEGRIAGEGALTPSLIADVFGVAAEIRGSGLQTSVDFRGD